LLRECRDLLRQKQKVRSRNIIMKKENFEVRNPIPKKVRRGRGAAAKAGGFGKLKGRGKKDRLPDNSISNEYFQERLKIRKMWWK